MKGNIQIISNQRAINFILPKHYSGRAPNISIAYGWFINQQLVACCTFGKPASNSLCKGICGNTYSKNVYELNRLCAIDNLNEQLSAFVASCLRRLRSNNWIIVSYADTAMHHNGYIYQACNFIYTGCTRERTDIYSGDCKHSRHYEKNDNNRLFNVDNIENKRKIRSAKHRYIFFCTFDKKLKKLWLENLKYTSLPYPKGENKKYILGQFLEDNIKTFNKI